MRRMLICVVALSFLAGATVFAGDEESLAQTAEQAGDLRQALTHYVAALQSVSENSNQDQQMREKIISLSQKITPPPVAPEEAQKYMARGTAAVKLAKDEQGFLKAAKEFQQALRQAPWLAEGYYNLGVVLDKAGKYQEAIKNLKLYLKASPNASDAQAVQNLIYEIEYRMEEAQKTKTAGIEEPPAPPDISGLWTEKGYPNSAIEIRSVINGIEVRRVSPFISDWSFYQDKGDGRSFVGVYRNARSEYNIISKDRIENVNTALPGFEIPELIGKVNKNTLERMR